MKICIQREQREWGQTKYIYFLLKMDLFKFSKILCRDTTITSIYSTYEFVGEGMLHRVMLTWGCRTWWKLLSEVTKYLVKKNSIVFSVRYSLHRLYSYESPRNYMKVKQSFLQWTKINAINAEAISRHGRIKRRRKHKALLCTTLWCTIMYINRKTEFLSCRAIEV